MERQVIVSAGDAITAKLVEEAGFDGIWISGFEASARLGLPDNGSITMTEMLNIAKPIIDAVSIPVWVDVDTGYGNFRRTLREFERIGVFGICVEDADPSYKQNSLWGDKIPLLDYEEFYERINIHPRSIRVIARTEALIRGYGIEDALKRAEKYSQTADIVLIHSRDKTGKESSDIICACEKQNIQIPIAIVPTKFPFKTNKQLFALGYSLVIWANQTERIKIKAIREGLELLWSEDCADKIEMGLSASLEDMRGLVNNG